MGISITLENVPLAIVGFIAEEVVLFDFFFPLSSTSYILFSSCSVLSRKEVKI